MLWTDNYTHRTLSAIIPYPCCTTMWPVSIYIIYIYIYLCVCVCLLVRFREVSNRRDWYQINVSFQIWPMPGQLCCRDVCQHSEQSDKFKPIHWDFETMRDLMIRHITFAIVNLSFWYVLRLCLLTFSAHEAIKKALRVGYGWLFLEILCLICNMMDAFPSCWCYSGIEPWTYDTISDR